VLHPPEPSLQESQLNPKASPQEGGSRPDIGSQAGRGSSGKVLSNGPTPPDDQTLERDRLKYYEEKGLQKTGLSRQDGQKQGQQPSKL
jgi:hypothetical protein